MELCRNRHGLLFKQDQQQKLFCSVVTCYVYGRVSGVRVVVQTSFASQTQFRWSVSQRQALAYSILPFCQDASIALGYRCQINSEVGRV